MIIQGKTLIVDITTEHFTSLGKAKETIERIL